DPRDLPELSRPDPVRARRVGAQPQRRAHPRTALGPPGRMGPIRTLRLTSLSADAGLSEEKLLANSSVNVYDLGMVDEHDERMVRVARAATKLRRSSSRLQRRLRSEGRRDGGGLSPGGASVLANLQRLGPATPGELAAADAVRPQSMTRILHDLESDGLV